MKNEGMINNHGAHYLRSKQEIWSLSELSPYFIRQEDLQGSPGPDFRAVLCLVDRRNLPKEVPQAPQETRAPLEVIIYLTYYNVYVTISPVGTRRIRYNG